MTTFASLRHFLAQPVFAEDEEKTRIAGLLNIILWGLAVVAVGMALATLLFARYLTNAPIFLLSSLVLLAIALGGQVLTRRGQTWLASVVLVVTLAALVTYVICAYDGVRNPAIAGYVLVIIIAGLLISGRAAVFFAVLNLVAVAGVLYATSTGLIRPASNAAGVADLILDTVVFGLSAFMLYLAASSISAAMETARRNTRAQVKANWALEANRLVLEARTRDLALAAEIGQRLGARRNLDQLLSEAVDLIRSRFDLYYVQVYLTDAEGRALVLKAGTGAVGPDLLRRQHRLPVGFGSINGMAAYEAHPILVADTASSPIFKPNPLLPNTRSEMSVPLVAGEKVLGVLDLQSAQPAGLSTDNLPAFEAVAGQLAVAVENTQLFANIEQVRVETEARTRQLTRANWQRFLNAVDRPEHLGFSYAQGNIVPVPGNLPPADGHALATPLVVEGETIGQIRLEAGAGRAWGDEDTEIAAAVANQVARKVESLRLLAETERYRSEAEAAMRRLTRQGWEAQLESQRVEPAAFLYDRNEVRPLLAEPAQPIAATFTQGLAVRGETIGTLDLDLPAGVDETATQVVTAVADRLSAHLENLRLTAQTESALAETDILFRASQGISQARNMPDALLGATELATLMGVTGITLVVVAPHTGEETVPTVDVFAVQAKEGHWVDRSPQLNTRTLPDGTAAATLLTNVREAPGRLVAYRDSADLTEAIPSEIRASLRTSGVRGSVTAGLSAREQLVGCLTFSSPTPFSNTPERYLQNLFRSLADQMAVGIDSLRLAEQTQKRAAELETVARVSTVASTLLDAPKLLQAVVDLTKYAFFLYHTHIYLLNETQDQLVLAAGAGEVGQQMVAQGWQIPLDRERSLVARAARERRGVIVNDVRAAPDFLPNPLLPETRAEMAVPIIVGDRLLGVFDVQADRVDRFTSADLVTQVTLAAQVAVALQNANLYAEQSAAVARLRELDQLKSAFLANMSHELRTPLNSVLGFAQVILEGLDGPMTENMEADLRLIEKNGQHLLNLINDVLDMAKIEAGRISLSLEPVNLCELLDEVFETARSLARAKTLYLELDPAADTSVVVKIDRFRIHQVFLNIIGNAIKFTETGGVRVHIARVDAKVRLRFIDTGIGIPLDKLDSIFEAFSQVDTSTTRKTGGTGLGLPISRRLVELHGGHLWAESRGAGSGGSVFIVEFPLDPGY